MEPAKAGVAVAAVHVPPIASAAPSVPSTLISCDNREEEGWEDEDQEDEEHERMECCAGSRRSGGEHHTSWCLFYNEELEWNRKLGRG